MLADLRDYLARRQVASVRDLALHFDAAPDAMRDMLDVWLRKGRVRRVDPTTVAAPGCSSGACATCSRCADLATEAELYAWVDPGSAPQPASRRIIALRTDPA
jgi:hypothetical protein